MLTAAKIFKSLADETRLRILLLLSDHGELCVCDLMTALELPQSTVSRHLAYLKNVGWLSDRRGGVWMYYSLRSGLDALHCDLVALLRLRCVALPEAVEDRARLLAYQYEKRCI
ncbi:metalloregulator ArsR/SmtB family transcription factor [Trichlorobacter sp.]|jgi:ArsR family transcriptional regulator|uniref:ArsR/SmtB family transcription factor n=1 Tax=Trichlorobacter sp. TaxID=2911007 RepID=UPI002A35C553|nr:metalloregulator ArsR/SmtB family transcription factor [Trichlorobacter sp.]MDY0385232.1 metalloregulator ArsR/SmtB family transcription factor [Trichlorobacter sp.]